MFGRDWFREQFADRTRSTSASYSIRDRAPNCPSNIFRDARRGRSERCCWTNLAANPFFVRATFSTDDVGPSHRSDRTDHRSNSSLSAQHLDRTSLPKRKTSSNERRSNVISVLRPRTHSSAHLSDRTLRLTWRRPETVASKPT